LGSFAGGARRPVVDFFEIPLGLAGLAVDRHRGDPHFVTHRDSPDTTRIIARSGWGFQS